MTLTDLRTKRNLILALASQYGARNVRVFGSVASGRSEQASDVDLLVEMTEERSLFDRIALKQDLEDLLGSSVDLVTDKGLHRVIKEKVLAEAVPL
ncbi:MAG: nucleotidyltransferase family protein [Magnetococcales bacterium]|nr:nucleotidyltransferase family protein [Magnetococcales bacterium]